MLNREVWRKRFVEAAQAEIKAGRLDRAKLAREFETATDQPAASKQAVYEWFRTGKVSDDRLSQLAGFLRLDLHRLKMQAVFRPAPAISQTKGRPEIPDLIRERARRLDPSIQKQILMLIETIIASSDPVAIGLEAENHKKAVQRHAKHP